VSGRSRFRAGAAALGVLAALSVATGAGVAAVRMADQSADSTGLVGSGQHTNRGVTRTTAEHASPAPAAPAGIPSASLFGGAPTIGLLRYTRGRDPRICSAAVVDSTSGNLVVTAAHCIDGKRFATNFEFIPGYSHGKAPYGVWPVRVITVASGWQKHHDPWLDLAFLTVGAMHGRQLQAVTGGLRMGFNLGYGHSIEAIAYNDVDTAPARCATRSFRLSAGQLGFLCNGFSGGTSGAPWVVGYDPRNGAGTLFGVIGGYEGGGHYDWASYSAYIGSALRAVYQQAERRSAAIARGQRAGLPPVVPGTHGTEFA
jgi:V8-like Glu-specific endopeptidase